MHTLRNCLAAPWFYRRSNSILLCLLHHKLQINNVKLLVFISGSSQTKRGHSKLTFKKIDETLVFFHGLSCYKLLIEYLSI